MKIAIDIRPALSRGTGVGTFVTELVRALDAREGNHELKLFSSSWKERWPSEQLPDLHKSRIYDRRWPVRLLNYTWHRMHWPFVEHFVGKLDIAHSPNPLILPTRGKRIVTLHDLYFLRKPTATQAEVRRDYVDLVRNHVHKADALISVSNATAQDAVELLGVPEDKLRVCWEGAAGIYSEPPTEMELKIARDFVKGPFFLFVGTIEPRKNLAALVRAFTYVNRQYPETRLVIAGARGWGYVDFDMELARMEDRNIVQITGYRDRKFLRALYHQALALIMPSHCEGFGLPLVEAMECGCPLIVANNSSLPEVAGEAALYWDNQKPEDLAGLLMQMLTDSALRQDLIDKGKVQRGKFSWDRTAERVLAVYKELC